MGSKVKKPEQMVSGKNGTGKG